MISIRFFSLSFLVAVLLFPGSSEAQNTRPTLSGYVKDASSGEALIGAGVYLRELKKGTATNTYGYFSITLDPGTYTLVSSYLGYQEVVDTIDLRADLVMDLELVPNAIVVKEFTVEGKDARNNTESTDMGRAELDVQKVKLLPALMGEVDLLKTLQYLPGVKSNGEGNSGFYVRGGGPDQNLILLDEATVYNASHLFGFFSVFNADAVKNIELIKGGIPANYGGRVSSVLDINMREGNDKGFHGQGGIGLISSRLLVEGPIAKDKASFLLAGRRTYVDVITKPFISDTSAFSGSGYYFYDVNAKMNYRVGEKDRLYLSGYFGRDVFTFSNNDPDAPTFRIPWGNATVSARWNHVFGPKLFLNTTATYSEYNFEFGADQEFFAFNLFSGIKDYGMKVDLSHYPSVRHTLKYGAQYIHHTYTPSTVTARSGTTDLDIDTPSLLNAHEGALYVLDEFDVTDELRVNAGLRLTAFAHVGPFDEYQFDEDGLQEGTVTYNPGQVIASYAALEPRISARYRLNERSSIKASFNRGQQYVHLASFSSIALPTDIWIPSGKNVKPLVGTQYELGYFRNFLDNMIETSLEVYYKDMQNLVEYAEGADPQANASTNFDTQLVFGNGYSYGVELFIKKALGRFNGWVGYTWSKTMRKFPDINEGREFPSRWDRRHDLSVVALYDLNKRWNFAATFVYSTGQAATLPVNRYFIEGRLVSEYTERNGYRMAPYHRMDIAVTHKGKDTKKVKDKTTGEITERPRKWESSWTFSVYNVYNRANPYFIYFDNEGNIANGTLQVVAKQVSLFSIIPSITWNFKF